MPNNEVELKRPVSVRLREQVGNAIWLLTLIWQYRPRGCDDSTFVTVANEGVITDNELAVALGVRPGTVAKWRRNLRRAGVLTWIRCGQGAHKLYVRSYAAALGSQRQVGNVAFNLKSSEGQAFKMVN